MYKLKFVIAIHEDKEEEEEEEEEEWRVDVIRRWE
jgi:hypothetical protein